jgi:SAM-dependent methyltransferase
MQPSYWQKINHIIGPAEAADFHRIGQKETRDAIEAFALSQSTARTSLLDAGCNTAVEGFRLFEKGFPGTYVGIDSNPKALFYALVNLSGRQASFALADLSSIPFPDAFFDIVINKDVIEHAAGYEPILGELTRLARRWFVLSTFIHLNDMEDRISLHPDGYHLNSYERGRLYGFLEGRGMGNPQTIFRDAQDEVIVFERFRVRPGI